MLSTLVGLCGITAVMDPRIAMDIACSAAEAWGALSGSPRLVQARENTVFEVRFADGRRAAMRLHRAGYQNVEAVHSEMRLCEVLADTGFACPWPQRTLSGALIHLAVGGDQVVTVVQWIDGTMPGAIAPGAASAAAPATFLRIGELLADLHLTADAVAPLDLARPSWRSAAFCAPDPRWGRYWEHPDLSSDESNLLRAARDEARDRLSRIPDDQTGYIHADVLDNNIVDKSGQLYLIDFDDSGPGYRLYDLATSLVQHVGTEPYDALAEALLDGYREGEGPLPESAFSDLPFFVMLRALASVGWIRTHAAPDDPRQSFFVRRAVTLSRSVLLGD